MPLDPVVGSDTLEDGRQKINLNDEYLEDLVSNYLLEVPFVSETLVTIIHNFGTKNLEVRVLESGTDLLIPDSVTYTDVNTVEVTFDSPTTGTVYLAR